MARKLRISTIGAAGLNAPAGTSHSGLVETAIAYWQEQFDQVLPDKPDFIAVPELCDSFDHLSHAEATAYFDARGNQVRDFFAATAKKNNCYITYPAARRGDDGVLYNTVQLIDRNGHVAGAYDKNHVVINETTEAGIYCGTSAPVLDTDFGRVAFVICFDLNFDALRLQYVEARPNLIVFPSLYHGSILQQYWAVSCRAHFVSAVGIRNLLSGVISPVGEQLATTTSYFNHITTTINLDCRVAHLDGNQIKLKNLKAKYGLDVIVHDPGSDMGTVLITSESETVTIDDMIAEFEIELLDDYLERSLLHHRTTGLPTTGRPQ